ncbi:MAG: DUF1573 domain-containing protein, partial [Aequorivita sp.]|nr:DUF1573 domain-containing protein [Aequorivita sp.]
LSVFAFSSCKDNAAEKVNEENVATAEARDAESGKFPAITFDENQFDFGTIDQGTPVEHVFKFKNTGEAPLMIVNAKGSCGCTVPEYSKEPVAPGADGQLLVKFNGSGQNQVSKTVTLTTNTKEGTETLTIKAFVTPKAGAGNEKKPIKTPTSK